MKYKTIPTEIEATQWHKHGDHPAVVTTENGDTLVCGAQGWVAVHPGDWIVNEPVADGHYPVKPEVFARKYTPAIDVPRIDPAKAA